MFGMLSLIQPLSAGNALRVFVAPPSGATAWRVLRKTSDDFTGHDDPGAFVLDEGTAHVILDRTGLLNGTTYYYRDYALVDGVWLTGETVSAVPAATYADESADPQTLLIECLAAGLRTEVQRGTLSHATGRVPVLSAPPVFEETKFPVVTVHLTSDSSAERSLGEMAGIDVFDDDSMAWSGHEGWLSRVSVTVVGWSLNPDQRIALRRAIKRIVIASLQVLDDAGLVQIDFSQSDTEDFQSYSAPVYQVMGNFSCLSPSVVSAPESAITDVTVSADVVESVVITP